ncbi:hypothetical protein [uncultured Cellulomonas sp.]|uniref:hypothetical protein n=1 Tax=uncultured Cellulomonas sp. TaxID=189682 RepID=UPI0028EE4918|nr:hypothetical protein [uncultured Cellulomonas sp.]
MLRARAGVVVTALVAVLLGAAVSPGSGAARVPGALPTPVASVPRLAFTTSGASIRSVDLVSSEEGLGVGEPSALEASGGYDGQPTATVTPAGTYTAFVSDRAEPTGGGDVHVRVGAGSDDERTVRITCDGARERSPRVSAAGDRVAYATDASGSWDIVVAPIPASGEDACAGGSAVTVAPDAGADLWPAWIADSSWLVFSSTRSADVGAAGDPLGDLFAADADRPDDAPVRISSAPGADVQPTVSPLPDEPSSNPPTVLVAFTTARFGGAGSIAWTELSGTSPTGPFAPDFSTLSPVEQVVGFESSEPAFPSTPSDTAFPLALAYTTTGSDPAGDVVVGFVGSGEGGPYLITQRSVLDTAGVAETHPTWSDDDGLGRGEARLTAEAGSTADVADVAADDGTGRRVVASSVRPAPVEGPPEPLGDASPSYSPSGDRFVHSAEVVTPGDTPEDDVRGWALHVVDVVSLQVTPLVYERNARDVDVDPVWSPDGRRIAFTRYTPGDESDDPQVMVLTLGSETPQAVALAPMPWERQERGTAAASWSPDGRHLVLERRTDSPSPYDNEHVPGLWVVDVDDGGSRPVTYRVTCPTPVCGSFLYLVNGRHPAWSPDGSQIAVSSLSLLQVGQDEVSSRLPGELSQVTLADPSLTDVIQVEATTVVPVTGLAVDGTALPSASLFTDADHPAWSPDGSRIALAARPVHLPRQWGIWEIAPDGTLPRRVTDTLAAETEPAYQPYTDLVLTLVSGPPTGTSASLTAVAANAGPGRVEEGAVDLALPTGVTLAGAPPGCVSTGAQITCPLPPLLPGQDVKLTVDVQLTGAAAAPVVGIATTTTPERVVTNNRAEVLVGRAGGVSVAVSIDRPVVFVGGLPATATLTVRNLGTLPAAAVRLTTTFPGAVVPAGADPCTGAGGVCELGLLDGGEVLVLTSTLQAVAPFEGPPLAGTVTGTVSTTSPDPQPVDDTAAAGLEVRSPQLSLSPAVVRPGGVVFVTGQHFPPGEPVTLRWSPGVTGSPGPFTVRDDGIVQSSLLLLEDSQLGARRLEAAGTSATPLFAPVDQDLLVVPTSAAAPSFLFRK